MLRLRLLSLSLGTLTLFGCADQLAQKNQIEGIDHETSQTTRFADTAAIEVTKTDVVPYGQFARNCSVSRDDLGTAVGSASGYNVYDTAPNTAEPRTHFITGFDDNCARQFTGALVLFGDVGTHELVRYANVGLDQPYSLTDEAYETIKGSFCRVARTEPCGRRIDRLAKTTSFVTVYESYADNSGWIDLLMHKGEMVAKDINS